MSDWTQGAGGPLYRSPQIMPGSVLGDALAAASAKSRKLSGWKTGMLAPVDRNIVTGALRPAVPMFVQDAIRGVMAPGKAMRGEYGLTASPDGRVSYDGMAEDAASLAGLVTLGSGAIPAETGTLRMGAKFRGDVPPEGFPVRPGETFNTIRNTEGAKNFAGNAEWMRLDPHGKWMSYDELPNKPGPDARWVKGSETFNKPLYIDQANGQWKQRLSEEYGGLVGKKLTEALRKDGYDAIVTFDKYGASEMVKLDDVVKAKK